MSRRPPGHRDEHSAVGRRTEPPVSVQDAPAVWDRIAPAWDAFMGEGGSFQRVLIGPVVERLLAVRDGDAVLELACGNGALARRLATMGAHVTASDVSAVFLEIARGRTSAAQAERITYQQLDATDEAAITALGIGRFAAAVCIMGIMDMAEVAPLMRGVRAVLRPGGCFVFAVMHPCFNGDPLTRVLLQEERDGAVITTRAVQVSHYLTPRAALGLGITTQPEPHWYFLRPLSLLLGAAFSAGFVLDALEEPAFPPEAAAAESDPLGWRQFPEIPPVLIARLRV